MMENKKKLRKKREENTQTGKKKFIENIMHKIFTSPMNSFNL